jgi:hypothetical protein
MGGSSAYINRLSNLVRLCRTCHREVTTHPQRSFRSGWVLRRGDEATQVPLNLGGLVWVTLTNQGHYLLAGRLDETRTLREIQYTLRSEGIGPAGTLPGWPSPVGYDSERFGLARRELGQLDGLVEPSGEPGGMEGLGVGLGEDVDHGEVGLTDDP